MKQVLGAINRQAEVNYAQVLNRTLLNKITYDAQNSLFLCIIGDLCQCQTKVFAI
jgi:hypothetical protein